MLKVESKQGRDNWGKGKRMPTCKQKWRVEKAHFKAWGPYFYHIMRTTKDGSSRNRKLEKLS